MASTILFLSLGAVLGASLRYALTLWTAERFGTAFPYGTFLVNGIGSLLLGLFLTVATGRVEIGQEMKLFIATGFCGSLTTFSTFSYETMVLLSERNYLVALLNISGNVVTGLLCVMVGMALGRLLG